MPLSPEVRLCSPELLSSDPKLWFLRCDLLTSGTMWLLTAALLVSSLGEYTEQGFINELSVPSLLHVLFLFIYFFNGGLTSVPGIQGLV